MRALLIILTCAVVVGVIVFVVVNTPVTPQNSSVSVARIELDRQPNPVLESDPAAENILNFFPEIQIPAPTTPEQATAPAQAEPAKEVKPPVSNQEIDRQRLLAMINDWVYVSYNKIGSIEQGRIHKSRENKYLEVIEGQTLDNGIVIFQLTNEEATLHLGEAAFSLRLALEPSFFKEVQNNPRPLTKEEQQLAFDYYQKRFGDMFRAYSKDYKPPPGMMMPRQLSPEEQSKGMEDYMKNYGEKFEKESKNFKQPFSMPPESIETYKKYWEQFHPDKPMPDFKAMMEQGNQLGPGIRIMATPINR